MIALEGSGGFARGAAVVAQHAPSSGRKLITAVIAP
jgi:hypothetical protein